MIKTWDQHPGINPPALCRRQAEAPKASQGQDSLMTHSVHGGVACD